MVNKLTVLLIDDSDATNEINKYYIKEVIEHASILSFTDGLKAIDFLRKCDKDHSPQLVLLDLRMPVFDGFDFLTEYKQIDTDKTSTINLFVSSTTENKKDFDRLAEFEFIKGFIYKPLTIKKVEEVLKMSSL